MYLFAKNNIGIQIRATAVAALVTARELADVVTRIHLGRAYDLVQNLNKRNKI